jgi:hypothetical protein
MAVPQLCSHCSRLNPNDASYCYFDGQLLQGHGAARGALNAGIQPFPSPFVFASGQSCRNFDQLALAFQQHWADARDLLRQGVLERFVGGLGRADLALAARTAAAFPDLDRGLDQLLARLPTQALPAPRLQPEPREISLGVLRPGAEQRFELHLSNQGGRLLFGAVTSDSEWLALGDGPGQAQKLFQCTDEARVPVTVRGDHLRARSTPLEGRLLIDSNGGREAVVVRVEVPVLPFPEGALAGAMTPREIALKAKQSPKEAAALFEKGAVAQWYRSNGWTYPVPGPSASGVAAVQQFFEALGLVKPPKVEVSTQEVRLAGRVGERLVHDFQVLTREKRHLYAHARSDQPWLTVNTSPIGSTSARVTLAAVVPPRPREVVQARVTVSANGNQRFIVPVQLTVAGGPPPLPVEDLPVLEMVEPLRAVTAAPTTALPGPALPAIVEEEDAPLIRRQPRRPPGLPVAVHAIPAGVLALALLGLIVHDILTKAPPPEEPGRTQVVIEGEDIHEKDGGPGPVVAEAPVDPVPRIYYLYNPLKRFGVSVAQTNKLLTFSRDGGTNMTILKVDEQTRVFGDFTGRWLHEEPAPPPQGQGQPPRYHSKNVWLDRSNIQVTQALDIVPSKQPVEVAPGVQRRLLDTLLVAFQIENTDAQPHRVGLRLEVDTLIGSNDGVPFAVPGQPGLIDSAADFRVPDKRFPDFLQALEVPNLEHPGTVAHLTVKVGGGLEPPGRISLTHWTGGFARWDVPLQHMGNDSAVILYWYDKELRPGEKRSLGFAYGLGAVASDAAQGKGKLGLTLSGSFEPGETFTVTAYVHNPAAQEQLTLQLPAGLRRIEGDQMQPVPPAGAGKASLVTWKVRVQQTGQFPLEVRSSTGLAQRRTITISRPDPKERPTSPDNIFR